MENQALLADLPMVVFWESGIDRVSESNSLTDFENVRLDPIRMIDSVGLPTGSISKAICWATRSL